MAESVKISNLPAATSVTSGNILPTVDASLTSTSKVTVQQIQDLGPGVNTVSDEHVKDGHLPAGKQGLTARNKIAVATSSTTLSPQVSDGTTTRIQCQEVDVQPFIYNTVFGCADGTALGVAINSSTTFPNGCLVGPGTAETPSYRFGSLDDSGNVQEETQTAKSGFFSDSAGSVMFSSQGLQIWSIQPTGEIDRIHYPTVDGLNVQPGDINYGVGGDGKVLPTYSVVAACSFTPAVGASQIALIGHTAVAAYFGRPHKAINWNASIGSNGQSGTDTNIYTLGATANLSASPPVIAGGNIYAHLTSTAVGAVAGSVKASRRDPYHYSWTGVTTNYHSPGDNVHYVVNTSGTALNSVAANPKNSNPWVGQLYWQTAASLPVMQRSGNIAGISYDSSTKIYTFSFLNDMPDSKYQVLFGHEDSRTTVHARIIMQVISKGTSNFTAKFTTAGGTQNGFHGGGDPGTAATIGTFDIAVVR